MPEKSNVHSEPKDEFAGMSGLKSHPDSKENSTGKKYGSTLNEPYNFKSNPETGTKVYIGKKITEIHEIRTKTRLNDTTLKSVSIDTDFKQNLYMNVKTENKTFSDTSIETDEFENLKKSQNRAEIENEEENVLAENSFHDNFTRKEKQINQNLSVDISSDFTVKQLPSGKEPLQLGSGMISGILGSGGMAKVYKIWNEKLEIFRAVKLLLPSRRDKETWNRFQTEAKISAKLNHPNIVEIHSIGEWSGLPYMEMELIEGETLSRILFRQKALPSFLCSAIAVIVSRALAYAHSQEILIYGKKYTGIIHRDLKPSNIMVGKSGIVKLMDFGVARPVETGFHTVNTESIVGTMHYFSPEQINGYPVDPLSDIYSFGAVLYEMICGINPFPYRRMGDLVQAKFKNSYKRLEDFKTLYHPALASVAQVCLRTDKSARFTGSNVLRDHLEKIHKSFNIGSPEEVVISFFQDPQKMYEEELQRRSISSIYPKTNANEKITHEKSSDVDNRENRKMEIPVENVNKFTECDDIFITNKNKKRNKVLFTVFAVLIIAIGVLIIGQNYSITLKYFNRYIDKNNKHNEAGLNSMNLKGFSE